MDAVLDHGHVEHGAGRGGVDVAVFGEDFHPPPFSSHVGEDPCLDGGEVGNDELITLPGDESGPYELGEHIRHFVVEEGHFLIVPFLHRLSCQVQVCHAVSWEVLQLDPAPCPPAAPGGAVELEHAPGPAVAAGGVCHGGILREGRLLCLVVEDKGSWISPDVWAIKWALSFLQRVWVMWSFEKSHFFICTGDRGLERPVSCWSGG